VIAESVALRVEDLRVETSGAAEIVSGVSFQVSAGEILALVGESGCGKTTTALALLGHARPGTKITRGRVLVDGIDLLTLDAAGLRRRRGQAITYVPQDPVAGLNPRQRIAQQVLEPLLVHGAGRAAAVSMVSDLFARVRLPTERSFLRRYPFELSGGQQQRVAIAAALAPRPSVVVLDEPTTGIDVTTQASVLRLLSELARDSRAAFVYVTHDLAVVNGLADRVLVMYAGSDVESGPRERVFRAPAHPYTSMLLSAVPRLTAAQQLIGIAGTAPAPGAKPPGCAFEARCPLAVERCGLESPPLVPVIPGHSVRCWRSADVRPPKTQPRAERVAMRDRPLVVVSDLAASYGRRRREVLHGISFDIQAGDCFALVGESGSGKTTLGRCVAGLHRPDRGSVELDGSVLAGTVSERTATQRRDIQIVFQNPDRSLNPRETVGRAIWRPLRIFEGLRYASAKPVIDELIDKVRLRPEMRESYPRELSGGERQRVAIARALAARPRLLICDEITSSLDVSIQATIVTLLDELRGDGLALLFITHNLALIRSVATQTLVMEQGSAREWGETHAVIESASHPYTQALIAAAPDLP
jgi:peptide/nickel transport system ATP-binding protein